MKSQKLTAALTILAFAQLFIAQHALTNDEANDYISRLQQAEKELRSSAGAALSPDVEKSLAPSADTSREQNHEAFINALVRVQRLWHDGSVYLKASAAWKEHALAGESAVNKADTQVLLARVEKTELTAHAAIDYAKAVVSFADALRSGQSGKSELQQVPEARKKPLEILSYAQLKRIMKEGRFWLVRDFAADMA
jgi:hypothetical protein